MTAMSSNIYDNRKSSSDAGLDAQGGSNLRKLDTWGRLLVPSWIRHTLGINENTLMEVAQLDDMTFIVKKRSSPSADEVLVPLNKAVKNLSVANLSAISTGDLKQTIAELEQATDLLRNERHARL